MREKTFSELAMTLSEFIRANLDEILQDWMKFARTLPPASRLDEVALRDEAGRMLQRVAADIARPGSAAQRPPHEQTAAQSHGLGRLGEGYSLNEMVAEFRLLRASVLRLWRRSGPSGDDALEQVARFDEALDQALSESVGRYAEGLERSRELFLGVLGHDLRSPLGAVLNSAEYLLQSDELTAGRMRAAGIILRSGRRIERMVGDLLDVARTRLGQALPVSAVPADLRLIARQTVEEAEAHHPESPVKLETSGDLRGIWDEARLQQMLSNLVENAIQHGAPDSPVTVKAAAAGGEVRLSVHNEGEPIPESLRERLFEPLAQAQPGHRRRLGLGLYIVSAIAQAHGGGIEVDSSAGRGTTFTVRLPREGPPWGAQAGAGQPSEGPLSSTTFPSGSST